MKTKSYILAVEEEIDIGKTYYFGQLWNGDGDGEELLRSESICVGEDKDGIPTIVLFNTIEDNEDILQTLVKIADIYIYIY